MEPYKTEDYEAREAKPAPGGFGLSTVDLFRLDNRTILITGGAGDLALAVAEAVMDVGGDIVLLDMLPQRLIAEEKWARIEAAAKLMDRRVTYMLCDTTSETQIAGVFDKFAANMRYPLRGLVACAGISEGCPALHVGANPFRRHLHTNVLGTFLVAQKTAKLMKQANVGGSMVLVASMSGTVVNKGVDTVAYNTSKSAVLQLGRSLAAEWGSRVHMPLIRVNTLSPGYIRTAATAETLKKPGIEQQWSSDNMLNRLSTADEYRGPVVFMLSDASSFMTASDLRVDGGHCAW